MVGLSELRPFTARVERHRACGGLRQRIHATSFGPYQQDRPQVRWLSLWLQLIRVQEEDVPSESVCLDCVSEHSVLITVSLSLSRSLTLSFCLSV